MVARNWFWCYTNTQGSEFKYLIWSFLFNLVIYAIAYAISSAAKWTLLKGSAQFNQAYIREWLCNRQKLPNRKKFSFKSSKHSKFNKNIEFFTIGYLGWSEFSSSWTESIRVVKLVLIHRIKNFYSKSYKITYQSSIIGWLTAYLDNLFLNKLQRPILPRQPHDHTNSNHTFWS